MKEGPLRQALVDNYNLYMYGAVLPDSPFYCLNGSEGKFFLECAEALHGERGEDSYKVLKRFFLNKGQALGATELSLVCGILAHIHADAHFHPMVFYYCGYTEQKNTKLQKKYLQRHYQFESFMDIYFWKKTAVRKNRSLKSVLGKLKVNRKKLAETVSEIIWGTSTKAELAIKMIRRHSSTQPLFLSRLVKMFLNVFGWLINQNSHKELFYPVRRSLPLPFFTLPVRYRHPVSGEWYQETIQEREEIYTEELCHLFSDMEAAWLKGTLFELFSDRTGPNLATGKIRSYNRDMKYFDTSCSIRKLITQYKGQNSIFLSTIQK